MLPAQDKDAPVTKQKFNLERDFPYRIQFVKTAAEAARHRAIFDRLAVLRNAPEPNLDAEEDLPDFESTLLEPESSTALPPVDGQPISPTKPEYTKGVVYHVDTGQMISVKGFNSQNFSDPYREEWEEQMFLHQEEEHPLNSSQPVAKDDKKNEISLKIPDSIHSSQSKPGISGPSKKTDTITYPKTQAMESQSSTSKFPKCPTEAETTQLSIAQATKSTDSPELINQLELRYPHKVYQYLVYPGMKVKVRTKDYCITCDPRYRRDRKTWLLHAKNRHYDGVIRSLYF